MTEIVVKTCVSQEDFSESYRLNILHFLRTETVTE